MACRAPARVGLLTAVGRTHGSHSGSIGISNPGSRPTSTPRVNAEFPKRRRTWSMALVHGDQVGLRVER